MTTEPSELLSIRGLRARVGRSPSSPELLHGVDFNVSRGEIVGLVGESGSGKTMTALAVLGLLPPGIHVSDGSIHFDGVDLMAASEREMQSLRGGRIAMIFQDALRHLNPAFTVGEQLEAVIRAHHPEMSRSDIRLRAIELFTQVQIVDPERRLRSYPHQFSGGMAQRVMIAMALSGSPELLLADEPTSALDVTVQAEILLLLRRIALENHMAVLFISHNLGAVWQLCDRVAVMYAGRIVEIAPTSELVDAPAHPYTSALLDALPRLVVDPPRLMSIPGGIPTAGAFPSGCVFNPRCQYVVDACMTSEPELLPLASGRWTRCLRADELWEGSEQAVEAERVA
jgi:oligopeptide/dipeptide ABC transporter ATP-binding protein